MQEHAAILRPRLDMMTAGRQQSEFEHASSLRASWEIETRWQAPRQESRGHERSNPYDIVGMDRTQANSCRCPPLDFIETHGRRLPGQDRADPWLRSARPGADL